MRTSIRLRDNVTRSWDTCVSPCREKFGSCFDGADITKPFSVGGGVDWGGGGPFGCLSLGDCYDRFVFVSYTHYIIRIISSVSDPRPISCAVLAPCIKKVNKRSAGLRENDDDDDDDSDIVERTYVWHLCLSPLPFRLDRSTTTMICNA